MATKRHLLTLEAQYRSSIGKSRSLHGKWAEAHKTNNWPLRHSTFEAWKRQVARSGQLAGFIQQTQAELAAAATTASMPLARAVATFEGGRGADGLFHPYQDAVRVWTIGYGHTAADGAPIPGPSCHALTGVEATTLLLHDINHFYAPAAARACKQYGLKPNQKQFDGLVSFAYNLGPGYFSPSHDVGMAMERHNWNQVATYILAYDHAGGAVLPGLSRRREWESQLIRGGHYTV